MQEESVTFIRHGQTDWNVKAVMMGAANQPLNESGLRQAKTLADEIRGKQYDIILSSPLQRAWSTANIIAEHHSEKPPLEELAALKELDIGGFTGQPRSNFCTETWIKGELKNYDGESYSSFRGRLARMCHDLFASDHRHILLVSHGKVFACLADMLGLSRQRLGNCEYLSFPKSMLAVATPLH